MPARVLSWAGAWAGFTTAVPEVDIVAVGAVIQPSALALTELTDANPYHLDKSRPLEFPDIVEGAGGQALQRAEAEREVGAWPRHPDHDLVER